MSTVVTTQVPARAVSLSLSRLDRIPWYTWMSVLAAACIMFGLYWDISWHETIGRDTFWTPAHLLIQFGAVLAGIYSAYLIFSTTFASDRSARSSSVRVLGFYGPLGAFICAWGGVAMITSAPFDNWWHEAYGLDVKIVSPPHTLLAMGFAAIMWGSITLISGQMNRSSGDLRRRLEWLLLLAGGSMVVQDMLFKLEYTNRVLMHSGIFYLVTSIGLTLVWEGIARTSGRRWARTAMAGFYTIFFLLALWIFPLFSAEPKLGPVYQRVTHMISLHFPVLILPSALALDLLFQRIQDRDKWFQAVAGGVVFVAVLIAVNWPFANFLMSPASRNWVFGTQQFAYFLNPTVASVRNVFFAWEQTTTHFLVNMGWALVAGIVSTRVGITLGGWLQRVQR